MVVDAVVARSFGGRLNQLTDTADAIIIQFSHYLKEGKAEGQRSYFDRSILRFLDEIAALRKDVSNEVCDTQSSNHQFLSNLEKICTDYSNLSKGNPEIEKFDFRLIEITVEGVKAYLALMNGKHEAEQVRSDTYIVSGKVETFFGGRGNTQNYNENRQFLEGIVELLSVSPEEGIAQELKSKLQDFDAAGKDDKVSKKKALLDFVLNNHSKLGSMAQTVTKVIEALPSV